MTAISVFCSANSSIAPIHLEDAQRVGELLAGRGVETLTGGGAVGSMGRVADGALSRGGRVRGAITPELAALREVAHTGLTELKIVADLFVRKKWLLEQAHGFLVLAGGIGTLDEALEALTWKALDHHRKPIVFLNRDRVWNGFFGLLAELDQQGFIRPENRDLFAVANDPESAVAQVLRMVNRVA